MTEFASGARVTHSNYGDGTIREVNEYHTRIEFDDVGLRTFATSKVVLQTATSLAPVKAPRAGRKKTTAAQKKN